jgi:twinkle protein
MYYEKLSNLGIKLRRRSGNEKTTCPQCSDGRRNKKDPCLSVNVTEGIYNCHNCGWKGNVKHFDRKEAKKNFFKPEQSMLKHIELGEKVVSYFQNRGVSHETLNKFMIHGKEEFMPQTANKERCIVFPYIRDTEIVNAKFRDGNKNFRMIKDAELIFFGMQTLKDRHCAIITEGEIDALSVYEAGFGNDYDPVSNKDGEVVEHELGRWAVLSVPNGASKGSQRLEYLDNCSDYMAGIDEFVIATDNDEAGISLRDELVRRLGAEKCRIVEYPKNSVVKNSENELRPCKDMNEVLIHFGKDVLRSIIDNSQSIPVDGIYYLDNVFPQMLEKFRKGITLGDTTRFGEFDDYFRWKKGDVNVFVGYANAGKTTFLLQLMLTKSIYDGWRWAIFSPENYPANDFYEDIIEMYVGKWISNMTEEEYIDACLFVDLHFFYVYPEWEHDLESISEKFRYLIMKKGVDGVMIDPFNQLDKNQKQYERDDQYISNTLKDVKRFALLNGVCYNIVMHPKSPQYNQDKSLPVVDMYDIAGGAMTGNKADQIISYYRPNYHIDKNDGNVQIHVQKVKRKRTGGKLGVFDLFLDWSTKRYRDTFGTVFCDPHKAQRILFKEQNGLLPDNEIETGKMPF